MKYLSIIAAILLLAAGSLACCCLPPVGVDVPDIEVPDIEMPDISVPTVEVGEMREMQESIPLEDTDPVTVEILFSAGDLEIRAGERDQLFNGLFRYNIEQWAPEVEYAEDRLTIGQQKGDEDEWGIPTGNIRNEWELEFSPAAPLEINIDAGAGDGELDFSQLLLTGLDLDIGAGDFSLRFDEPNQAEMDHLTLRTGASRLEVTGIGNAGPEEIRVDGGAGDITLDFTGEWPGSTDAQVTTGVGSLTLRLPDDVGVWVEVEGGLSNVEASGLRREGDAYLNDLFDEAETELRIEVTTGIGNVRLIEVSND